MTHSIIWNRNGWQVLTTCGDLEVSAAIFDTYGECLSYYVEMMGA